VTGFPEQVLVAVEERLRAEGVALEDMDRRIAERLNVPVDYYFVYLLVRGAIHAHAAQDLEVDPTPVPSAPSVTRQEPPAFLRLRTEKRDTLDAGTPGGDVGSSGVRHG